MAAFSTFLRFLKWKMDGRWKMENGKRIHHSCVLLGSGGEVAKRPFRVASVQKSAYPTLSASGPPRLLVEPLRLERCRQVSSQIDWPLSQNHHFRDIPAMLCQTSSRFDVHTLRCHNRRC